MNTKLYSYVLWGMGVNGLTLAKNLLKEGHRIVAFIDTDSKKWNKEKEGNALYWDVEVGGEQISCLPPKALISTLQYDKVIITVANTRDSDIIEQECLKMGVDRKKIIISNREPIWWRFYSNQRTSYVKKVAEWMLATNVSGCVAEAGVFRGDFAKYINGYFYDRKCYLFDTFKGFHDVDFNYEKSLNDEKFMNGEFNNQIRHINTSKNLVLSKMPFPEKIVIKEGYFPESAEGIQDIFCFVNLDMDLYLPILAGLRFFWDKMVTNGIILIHDYFMPTLPGVKKAVEDFEKEKGIILPKTPIGDKSSMAVIKL